MNNIQLLGIGKDYFTQGDLSKAMEFFMEILSSDSEHQDALFYMGLITQKKGQIEKSKKYFFRVLSNNPNHSGAMECIKELLNLHGTNAISQTGNLSPDEYNDFRVAKWGDSKQSVMLKENIPNLSEEPTNYSFLGKIAGKNCFILYSFISDMLYTGVYMITENYTNLNLYISDYEFFVNLLKKKYGNCIPDDSNNGCWLNPLWQDDRSQWGFAISTGDLFYKSEWDLGATTIVITLMGNNYNNHLIIRYESKKLKLLSAQEDEKNNLIGL